MALLELGNNRYAFVCKKKNRPSVGECDGKEYLPITTTSVRGAIRKLLSHKLSSFVTRKFMP
jgi:hypothetical protein